MVYNFSRVVLKASKKVNLVPQNVPQKEANNPYPTNLQAEPKKVKKRQKFIWALPDGI
jgi:hypothetical protein